MQVMPFWAKLIGTPDQNLFNLRTNLRYGCVILRHYLDIENGDSTARSAATTAASASPSIRPRVMAAMQPLLRVHAGRRRAESPRRRRRRRADARARRRAVARTRAATAAASRPRRPVRCTSARSSPRSRAIATRAPRGGEWLRAHRGRRRAAQPRRRRATRSSRTLDALRLRAGTAPSCASRSARARYDAALARLVAAGASSTRAPARAASSRRRRSARGGERVYPGHVPRRRARAIARRARSARGACASATPSIAFVDRAAGPAAAGPRARRRRLRRAPRRRPVRLPARGRRRRRACRASRRRARRRPPARRRRARSTCSACLGLPTPDVPARAGRDQRARARSCRSRRARRALPDDPVPALLAAWRFLDQPLPDSATPRVGGRVLGVRDRARGRARGCRRCAMLPAPRVSTASRARGIIAASPARRRVARVATCRRSHRTLHDHPRRRPQGRRNRHRRRLAHHVRRHAARRRARPHATTRSSTTATPTSACAAPPRTSSCSRACCAATSDARLLRQVRDLRDVPQAAPDPQGAALPQSEGGGGRPVRVDADHGADRQRARHLRRLLDARGVRVHAVLGGGHRAASSRSARCTRCTRG